MIVENGFVAPDGQPPAQGDADAKSTGNDATDAEVPNGSEIMLSETDPVAQGSDQEQREAVAVHSAELQALVVPSVLLPG